MVFFFNIFKMSIHCVLFYIVYNEETAEGCNSSSASSLCNVFSLSLETFKSSSVFGFQQFENNVSRFFFFVFVLKSLDLLFDIFHYLWKKFQLLFLLSYSLFSLWDSDHTYIRGCLLLFQISGIHCFIFSPLLLMFMFHYFLSTYLKCHWFVPKVCWIPWGICQRLPSFLLSYFYF